ncbi:hypothetical protein B0H16DRAFT_1610568 [Mycena metata]|uniref:Uncharacterized protein n=1 Tax=Mycena metata TaxID=1033252 RepID=A0AAD7HD76_9AGAR|nr:hypothetical protein B0H16DRAFT_1638889 [Mycena metata]KAJ7717720.1 hypothetical protein B0H16DRAFT_1610568 [Mycena metata]
MSDTPVWIARSPIRTSSNCSAVSSPCGVWMLITRCKVEAGVVLWMLYILAHTSQTGSGSDGLESIATVGDGLTAFIVALLLLLSTALNFAMDSCGPFLYTALNVSKSG